MNGFIADLNPTPYGPPAGLSAEDSEKAMAVWKRFSERSSFWRDEPMGAQQGGYCA